MPATVKCMYWETCFRKDQNHLASYLHPADEKTKVAEDPTVTTLRKKETVEVTEDGTDSVSTEPAVVPKETPIKRKTHEISVYEDDEEPETKKARVEKAEPADTSSTDPEPSTSSPTNRVKCKYWKKCFRKDKGHKKFYVHPGDPDEKTALASSEGRTRNSKRPQPMRKIDSMDTVKVKGFKLKRTGSMYECNCEHFTGAKNFGKSVNKKTCPHLMAYLGEEFERIRCDLPKKGQKERIPNHINISVLLAHKYQDGVTNPTGWWMSEKLDGVRAYWNGKCFYSRLGNAFHAPAWFTQDLPADMHLDGELFGGRKKFQSTVSIVKTPQHPNWNKIMYCVFDAPHIEKEPFEKRMKAITDYFDKAKPQYAKFCTHEKCTGTDQVDKELKRIIALGGEGLMIRQPGSKYERTRSKTLLKIKKFHDAEAIVVGHEPSKSNPGQTGALWVKMASGKKFKVGSGLSNQQRRKPPKVGTIITYKFQEYTNSGTPRFPTFLGIRIDMTEPKDAEGVVTEATDD